MMKLKFTTGVATAALTIAACFVTPASAGGLFDRSGARADRSDYVPYMRDVSTGAGPCYFRADVGYSVSRDPKIKWPVNSLAHTYTDTNGNGSYDNGEPITATVTTFVGDAVSDTDMGNSWFGEAGFGCGSGSAGFRAELMFGVHGSRNITGQPADFSVTYDNGGGVTNTVAPADDPLHTSLRTYTAMLNIYKDLGNYGRITPYVGFGLGVAYHRLDEVYFTGNPLLTNKIAGNNDLAFAWSLMAGVGYQVSERAILDFGYRFIDMGSIESGRVDSGGFVNPAVAIDDIRAHEFKIGLRYHFGGSAPASYK